MGTGRCCRRLGRSSAWVLLGEPGAGKTTALEAEAKATDGHYLRLTELINGPSEECWRHRTLFLDGLDEMRSTEEASVLQKVRRQLIGLGNPPFRIACRPADWYGGSDREDLDGASPDRQITILALEALNENDIVTRLRGNHGVGDPQSFVDEAEKQGLAGLLNNPQTLGLFAGAISSRQWPATRDDTYRLA